MTQSVERFWEWFEQNNKAYLFLNAVDKEIKEELLNKLLEHLHDYCDKLWFEIGGPPDLDQELIITAEGNIDYFQKVETLIAAAPIIKSWTFISFIPPRSTEFEINYEGVILTANEMWFEPLENLNYPADIGIKVCTANYQLVKESKWLTAAVNKILDTILGEKSFALDIEYVSIDQLSEYPEEEGMIKLDELPAYVSWKKSKYQSIS